MSTNEANNKWRPTTCPALFDVEVPPRVLVGDRVTEGTRFFVRSLAGLRLPVNVTTPDRFSVDLAPYAVVVLNDLIGDELTPDQRLVIK